MSLCSQAGSFPLFEWKGEAETDPDTHVGIGGITEVPQRHTHNSSLIGGDERGALARRPKKILLVVVPLLLVLGVAVIELVAAAAARSQERALFLLRAAIAKFH